MHGIQAPEYPHGVRPLPLHKQAYQQGWKSQVLAYRNTSMQRNLLHQKGEENDLTVINLDYCFDICD